MIEPKSRELRAVRIEVALKMCIDQPSLFWKAQTKFPVYSDVKEKLKIEVLRGLMRQEPCIKNILSFYYKRESR
jgi:uncharacterized Rmd1/YagE family protein